MMPTTASMPVPASTIKNCNNVQDVKKHEKTQGAHIRVWMMNECNG